MKSIRAFRQERGWTQFELALRLGVPPQAVRRWESGHEAPSVPHLRRLAGVFDLRIAATAGTESRSPFGRQDDLRRHVAEP